MSDLVFTKDGWDDYTYWQGQDKKTLRRINDADRLVYKFESDKITIYQCRSHYSNNN